MTSLVPLLYYYCIIKEVQTASVASGGSGVIIIIGSVLGVSIFGVTAIIITISAVLCLIKEGNTIATIDYIIVMTL
jgi:hypothetical protein